MAATMILDPEVWDLLVDDSLNIAVATEPYAQAQDAASEIKVFSGEQYYDTSLGLPYWPEIFGKVPPLSLIKSNMQAAALRVPGVATATVVITSFVSRHLRGQVLIVNESGESAAAGF